MPRKTVSGAAVSSRRATAPVAHAKPRTGPSFRLDGQVALVTGATRGLGLEIAAALAGAGARVFLNGRNRPVAAERAKALTAAGMAVEPLCFDVADRRTADKAIATLERRAGRLDILVNNVGQRDRRPIEAIDAAAFEKLIKTDLVAAYALCRRAATGMVQRGHGRIINVTSIAGDLARPGDPAYTAAKGGLAALTRALAADLGVHGVTCNAISPGFFATETNRPIAEDHKVGRLYADRVPLRRWGEPAEIGGAAVFLASPAGSYVNGHTLVVDGGVSATYAMI